MNAKIRGIILSYKADPSLIDILEERKIEIILTKAHPFLPKEIDDHPDMTVLPLDRETFLVEKNHYDYYFEKLSRFGKKVISTEKPINGNYPRDIRLNIAQMDKYFWGKEGFIDPWAKEYFENQGKEFIPVNQGYANCSSMIVKNSIITQDKSIFKEACKKGIEVHLLPQGGIKLPGYSTGFIGGTYGMINDTVMVFYGDPAGFEHQKILRQILEDKSVDLIYPKEIDFLDRGSMIGIY